MSLTDLETSRSLRRAERALKRRERTFGISEVVMAKNEITETDRNLFGRPVRFEVDVCVPIEHLRKDLNMMKADLADCLRVLDMGGSAHDRRFGVHRKLSAIRAKLSLRKKELSDPNLTNVLRGQSE